MGGNILIILGLVLIVIGIVPVVKQLLSKKKAKRTIISEWSYKRYADFYGKMELADPKFYNKIARITSLIVNDKEEDINVIAQKSGCTYEECLMKINYLKNKRKIGDYYIDSTNHIIRQCSKEDQELLNKYKPFLYSEHLQIDEMAARDTTATMETLGQIKEKTKNDIKHLLELCLLNGVKYNEVDNVLTYYSVEKHNKAKDLITVECDKCGALNDVERTGKVKCIYCSNIIEGSKYVVPDFVAPLPDPSQVVTAEPATESETEVKVETPTQPPVA